MTEPPHSLFVAEPRSAVPARIRVRIARKVAVRGTVGDEGELAAMLEVDATVRAAVGKSRAFAVDENLDRIIIPRGA